MNRSFEDMIRDLTGEGFIERRWLYQEIEQALTTEAGRFILVTGEPGAGKTSLLAGLGRANPSWLRYFIRRDSRTALTGGDVQSFLLAIGDQFARLRPELFHSENLKIVVRQRVNSLEAGGSVVGIRIEDLTASPFYQTAALTLDQQVDDVAGDVRGIEIGTASLEPRLLEPGNLAHLALIDPAEALFREDPGARIVVLLDALDELAGDRAAASLLDWVREGPELPPNVSVVITSRAHRALELIRSRRGGQLTEVHINPASPEVADDLLAYAGHVLPAGLITAAAGDRRLAADEFRRKAVRKASGNFLYLSAYARALANATSRTDESLRARLLDLADFPQGLEGLYRFFAEAVRADLDRFDVAAQDADPARARVPAWEGVGKPIFSLLTVAREPLAVEDLIALGDIRAWPSEVDGILEHMRWLLAERDSRIAFYHSSFGEFLSSDQARRECRGCAVDVLEWHERIVRTTASGLPVADSLDPAAGGPARTAWWDMSGQGRYMWDHLIEHLVGAGRHGDAEVVAADLRWVGARLERFGPAAPVADLTAAGTPRAVRLRRVLARTVHLLAPAGMAGAAVDILASRVADDPDWGPQVTALRDAGGPPRLVNLPQWPLPDLAHPALRRVLTGHMAWVSAVAISPDGSWLASASYDETVRIWDKVTEQERLILEGHADQVTAVAISPDGSWLASASEDKTVRIWDAATGRERAVLAGHTAGVSTVAVAPDGNWLASAGWDHTVRIWDTATGQQRAILKGHADKVSAVVVAPDGSWLASASRDETVRIWDAATGREQATLRGHSLWVDALAVAPNGNWLASGGLDGTVRLWDTATRRERAVLTGDAVMSLAVAPDSSWLASGGQDSPVRLWDTATRRERAVLTSRTGAPLMGSAVAIAPDGSWLASTLDDRVQIWDTPTMPGPAVTDSHVGKVDAVAAARDGSWLASGGEDGTVRVWDAATGQQRAILTGHNRGVTAVAFAFDDTWLVSGGGDKTVRMWDTATGRERGVLASHDDTIGGVTIAVAPDSTWLASADWDHTARVWDAVTGQQQAILKGHTDAVIALTVAPDGSWLASGGVDGTVRVWDPDTGQQRAVLPDHTGWVMTVAAAPNSRWLASGADDTLRVWDACTSTLLALMRVDGDIFSCAWLGSSALIVGGSEGLYLFDFLWPGANR